MPPSRRTRAVVAFAVPPVASTIVDDQHALPGRHRVVVDLEGVGAVLELVASR